MAFIKRLKENMDYEFRALKGKGFSTIDARKLVSLLDNEIQGFTLSLYFTLRSHAYFNFKS